MKTVIKAPKGIKSRLPLGGVPAPMLQLGIGIPFKTELVLRYSPEYHRKGIDIAINVVNKINFLNKKVILDIYGPSNKTYDYAWSSHVRYKGLVPFGDVESTISKYDFLILPSRFDGWGVVINEALLARVPVICSNQAGASSLVKKWDCGVCYDSSNESELEKIIEDIFLNKEIMFNHFKVNLQKTVEVITPKIGAEFILSSIETEKNENKKNNWYV